jgi:hypothetical protein
VVHELNTTNRFPTVPTLPRNGGCDLLPGNKISP